MPHSEDWREVLGPLDPDLVALHRRVAEAELRLATLRLGELRRRRGVSQAVIAEGLDVSQPNVSRIEQQADLRLSTLSRYIAALGGRLELRAAFDDETLPLTTEPSAKNSSG